MTNINIATDIPSNITTLEQLAAWAILGLARCNPSLKILESPDQFPRRAAEAVLIKADDNSFRLVGRVVLPVVDSYPEQPRKFWENIEKLDDVALPSAFKSN